MSRFLQIMRPRSGSRILDVGGLPSLNGTPGFWEGYTDCFSVSLLNLPGAFDRFSAAQLRPYALIEADACRCDRIFEKFDIVFSNALIEHVGNLQRQKMLADFIRTVGNGYWVQTPSPMFPLEAHCDIPFWWFAPLSWRRRQISKWKRDKRYFLAQWHRQDPFGRDNLSSYFLTRNRSPSFSSDYQSRTLRIECQAAGRDERVPAACAEGFNPAGKLQVAAAAPTFLEAAIAQSADAARCRPAFR
ncbi:class I SAM-dependent methyltransferase [Bradyrhizobium sp. WYCCWR 13023]|uniref:Class I SAM-dependent methyltransferase n=1 Tax=Bradyrhizobium zhengyangense TaxID=2911009 RepID=A0A9X1UCZ4_9BRAD|nr:class I SAM-dependent methyltransferase [Bradyrhizobium zhengyangense]MCG2633001.1 class I SAM-dependent methyltransferase [Bradyrhizobium zhengyangense]